MDTADVQVDVIIPTQTKYLDLIGSIGEQIARQLDHFSGDHDELAYHLNLVLTEATSNAIRHANGSDSSKDTVRITISIQDDVLTINVYDHGQGFDLDTVPAPDLDHPKEGGLGIFLIKTLMDSVTYTRTAQCNVLEMRKSLK